MNIPEQSAEKHWEAYKQELLKNLLKSKVTLEKTLESLSEKLPKQQLFFLEKYIQAVTALSLILMCATCTLSGIAIIAGEHEVLETEPLALPLQEIVMASYSSFNGSTETDFARSIEWPLLSREDFGNSLMWPTIALDGTAVFDSGGPFGIPGYLMVWNPETREIEQLLEQEVMGAVISPDGRFVLYSDVIDPDDDGQNVRMLYSVIDLDEERQTFNLPDDSRRFRGWSRTNIALFSNTTTYFSYDPVTQIEQELFTVDQLPGQSNNIDMTFVHAVNGGELFYIQTEDGSVYQYWVGSETFVPIVQSDVHEVSPFSVSPSGQYYFYRDDKDLVMHEVATGQEWTVQGPMWAAFVTDEVVVTTYERGGSRVLRHLLFEHLSRTER
jgi:hypothetical protein